MFNDFVYVFVKVGCGFRFLLRKKSKSSTHPTTRDFLMCISHRQARIHKFVPPAPAGLLNPVARI